jgi:glyoxylase-like metal-dependent hydrolase (beta-lactamase superfamily II)
MRIRICLLTLSFVLTVHMAFAQQGGAQPGQPAEIKVTTTKLGGNVYAVDGQGGRMAALIGPDGVFLVDAQFPAVTEKIVAAIKEISPAPIKFLVNTHVHGDHSGGNENFAKLGVTVLGRPNLRNRLLKPVAAPNGQVPPVAPPQALPVVLYDQPLTVMMNGETVQLIPLPNSHTDGDTAVKFVVGDVLMTGDVFRSVGFPAADRNNGGTLKGLLESIETFISLSGPNTRVVPGHGPITDRAALVFHREVIVTVSDRIAKAISEGKTLEQVRASKPTADFEQRVAGPPNFIAQFVDTLYAELSAGRR